MSTRLSRSKLKTRVWETFAGTTAGVKGSRLQASGLATSLASPYRILVDVQLALAFEANVQLSSAAFRASCGIPNKKRCEEHNTFPVWLSFGLPGGVSVDRALSPDRNLSSSFCVRGNA